MAPKATTGGVSNANVHPDYIAPEGMRVEDAIEQGIPDAGNPDESDEDIARRQQEYREGGEQSSPGQISEQESPKPESSTTPEPNETGNPSSAPSTSGPSSRTARGGNTVSTAGTSSSRK